MPVAIVTGGAQGLGAAVCQLLLEQDYKVCIADIEECKGEQLLEELKTKFGSESVIFSSCDVSREEDFERTFRKTIDKFLSIDVLINNAGIVMEQNPRKLIDVNLIGPIFGCQLAIKYMSKTNGGKGGVVINTSSILGFVPYSALPSYVASKHALIGLTRSFGLPYHFSRDGITFSALCPSLMKTNILKSMNENSLTQNFDVSGFEEALLEPEYVAKGVLKIFEDRINGSTLVVTKRKGFVYIGVQEELKDIPVE
ncbi:15-hydroxyprostaglandin dehydrogenase [NAD(+)]-like [Uloborus diversus]|uniref:15-hydroxyprostaglandin dehydrogenase [NAD(+)]-like n=1 Tax=Uloborus diversus TaxID=327109 RepID=UPI002409A5B4|nr:15-hydroxyprostaglandin dehydrogenase [NAD(+)]-like [Uloborus diversus]